MTEGSQPETRLPENYQAGRVIGRRRPDEVAFPLRNDEFLILTDGTAGEERAGRDLCLGFLVGAVIGLAGLIASVDWGNAWAEKKWWVFACLLVLLLGAAASVAGCCLHWSRMGKDDTPETRLKQKIDSFFATSASSGGASATGQGAATEIGRISFDYLPSSPLDRGWKLVERSQPGFSFSAVPNLLGGLAAEVEGAVDLKLEEYQRVCDSLQFRAKLSERAHVYARVRVVSRDSHAVSKLVWLACDMGGTPPRKESPDEWVICRSPGADGWALFDLSLPDEVSRTFGQADGLEFSELWGFRLRGSLSISPIRLLRRASPL
jgi:hypothetical protein